MAETSENSHVVVAAVDFGTTFTGYAFSFRHNYKQIITSTFGGKLQEDRVPTTVLLKPDKTFHSFGFTAEDMYARLLVTKEEEEEENEGDDGDDEDDEDEIDEDEPSNDPKDWFYFRHFKMALYTTKNITEEMYIYDSEGRSMKAMTIFRMVINYLRELAEDIICKTKKGLTRKDIQWMITIPAIWTDSARQFMRKAATSAGIHEDQLRLVLEPEAASLYCSMQQTLMSDESHQIERLPVGSKYILADLGGGTADICAHEIMTDGKIRELYRASGEALGGTCVDTEFWQFLIKLVGADVLMKFKLSFPENYLNLLREFEKGKKIFDMTATKLIFSLSPTFTDLVQLEFGQSLKEIIPHTSFPPHKLTFLPRGNKLKIDKMIVRDFFDKSIDGIKEHLKEILQETGDRDINTLILVGGYSESPYLREKIQAEMGSLTVILEPEANLAVLKGAVLMGYKPRTIVERRARFTYGFSVARLFIEGVHPESLKFVRGKKILCNKIFHKLISRGQILKYGQAFTKETTNHLAIPESKHLNLLTPLYKSPRTDPKYCIEEEECTMVGEIVGKAPVEGWPDRVELEHNLIVGETEFTVNVFNKSTKEEIEANMNFL